MQQIDGEKLYERAKKIIPGGTQLLSKRPELAAPGQWPPYAIKSLGSRVWDLDNNVYVDMTTMGIGSCILGYADPVVNEAVKKAVDSGSMSSLNCPEEVELAELLLEIHPWAQMVRFARTGGEMISQAVRIARAATGRDKVLFCGYHGWHDWYLASNLQGEDQLAAHLLEGLEPNGVPSALKGTSIPFHYNMKTELDDALKSGKPAAIIIEPLRYKEPEDGFLDYVRAKADESGAVLIFDEVTSGWRHVLGGVHKLYQIEPDIAVFAKAISNGYPCAAIVGREDVMQAAQSSFISSTYWTERIGSVAALTTIRRMIDESVSERLFDNGTQVQNIWRETASENGITLSVEGRPALTHFIFKHDKQKVLNTLLSQEMLKRGFLANTSYYASMAHSKEDIETYGEALSEVFSLISKAIESGKEETFLEGDAAISGFTRLT